MNRYGKRCVLYPRVSTEMQVDGYSLEGQKNMLTRFADREEMIVVDTYEDAGKSGKSIEGRPAFQKMLRDIEDGLDIDYILVYKLSRFGRNAADILNSLELVQSYGVNLICIEEGIDSSQTSGKLLISVLSAVAEIERENIIEQTMNGRREKARQGGWNGGFAPYGYTLEDNKLMIEETEAVAIRKIFELYTSSEIGLGGIANQLNLQGIRKIPRQNGTLEDWTGHFIKLILDNPVYCGKIAYGRRTKEKVKGTKNDYQMKRNDDYILTEGQHKGIVSEEVWEKAHAKRLRTGVKQPSKIGRDRVHLLSGLLKCPVCGSPMYTNKHAWTNKDGTYKEIYYYVCSRNRMVRGKHCEYKAMLKKTDIEPMVIEAIREIVRNEEYAQAIKERIGVQIDTKAVDKELEGYQAKLKEVDLNKTRLEREIDSLPADAKYRERKLHDMTLRLDSLYDVIVELEEKIEDARLRRDAIKQQAITLENIYKIMVNFDCVYNIINDEEKRNVVTALIKEIEIYRNDESEYPLKRIGLNFPVFKDGGEVTELLWDKGNTVEWIPLLAYTAARTGGEFDKKALKILNETAEKLAEGEAEIETLTKDMKYYPYYLEAYSAALGGLVGEYEAEVIGEDGQSTWQKKYGLKGYCPIARGFDYTHYDDFGAGRSYGYKRRHLGHDMMGLVGVPIIAVESGTVEALGWNQYGGWRIGIRSFDNKRYYYYAHLRQNYPYAEGLEEGSVVTAGDVIGYMGHTGYSTTENVNNIEVTHLHWGLELVFDEEQKESDNEIWIDVYPLTCFLAKHTQEVQKVEGTREWIRTTKIREF